MKNKKLNDLFNTYIDVCEFTLRRRPATIKSYRDSYQHFINLIPDVIYPHQLSQAKLNEFFKLLQTRKRVVGKNTIKKGVKDSTIATYWSKLNTFFVWLESTGHIDKNPLKHIKKPKEIYDNKPALKRYEVERLYSSITLHNPNTLLLKRDTAIVSTLFFTGVRKTELISLQVRDVDLEKNILTVRGQTSKSKRTREIPINPTLRVHLKDYLVERKTYKTEKLFVSLNNDGGLTHHGISHWVKRMVRISA